MENIEKIITNQFINELGDCPQERENIYNFANKLCPPLGQELVNLLYKYETN